MILDKIVAQKRKEIAELKNIVSTGKLMDECRSCGTADGTRTGIFFRVLRKPGEVALIAEVKKASPSKGLIRRDFDPAEIGRIYTAGGASAISVLTDMEFFQGSSEYLRIVRDVSDLPVLRKDFIVDCYQIYEAKLLGADAILLIMAVLTDREAREFREEAAGLGMECLVEVHTDEELKRALSIGAHIIGINNRDLRTFKTDLNTTFRLREVVTDPEITVVSESGINSRLDVIRLGDHGVHAMLVGEALMREPDIGRKMAELLGKDGLEPGTVREMV